MPCLNLFIIRERRNEGKERWKGKERKGEAALEGTTGEVYVRRKRERERERERERKRQTDRQRVDTTKCKKT